MPLRSSSTIPGDGPIRFTARAAFDTTASLRPRHAVRLALAILCVVMVPLLGALAAPAGRAAARPTEALR